MTSSPPPLRYPDKTKTGLNLGVAIALSLLSLWMVVADFSYTGDLLFQTSASFLISFLVFSLLFVVTLVVAIFPKRMIVGINLLLLCRLSYGFPFSLVMDSSFASRLTSVLMLLLSAIYLFVSLKKMIRTDSRPWVKLKHTLVVLPVWILTGVLAIPMLILGAGYGARGLLGDYTELSLQGVDLTERVFEKDGQRVYLVGMMHIGDGSYYSDLKKRMNAELPAGENRLVLTEGVSDKHKLLPRDFANGTTYAKLAEALGLEAQKSLESSTASNAPTNFDPQALGLDQGSIGSVPKSIVWQNADIDISELEEHHQTLLLALLGILSGGNLQQMLVADVGDATGEDLEDLFKNGLIVARNQALMQHFDAMLPDFTEVYVPWGAAHLPDLEQRLIQRGFQQVSEIKRPVVAFWD